MHIRCTALGCFLNELIDELDDGRFARQFLELLDVVVVLRNLTISRRTRLAVRVVETVERHFDFGRNTEARDDVLATAERQ